MTDERLLEVVSLHGAWQGARGRGSGRLRSSTSRIPAFVRRGRAAPWPFAIAIVLTPPACAAQATHADPSRLVAPRRPLRSRGDLEPQAGGCYNAASRGASVLTLQMQVHS